MSDYYLMTYAEKLRDPRWQRKRLEILDRDGWACCSCGSKKKNLQVHHLIYSKLDPWEYPDYVFQTLCYDCHQIRKEITDRATHALRLAISKYPTERMAKVAQNMCDTAMNEIEVGQ